ncbi:MAG: cache domain-containing protein [Lachnospiraceae bacterium]|nr:cache domain-containing protein [Lachnospiraceae bacterium]
MNQRTGKIRLSLPVQIGALALVPLLALAIILSVVGAQSIREGITQEIFTRLEDATIAMSTMADAVSEGDYELDADNNLIKGDYNLTQHVDILDSMVEGTDMDVTFFYDKTRRATTLRDKDSGERILGTDASDAVYETVVKNGESMTADDLVINGEPYYAYYAPLKNSNGEVIGMLFAGAPATETNEFINGEIFRLVRASIIVAIIASILIVVVVMNMRKAIYATSKAVNELSEGNLSIMIDTKTLQRSDELGDMAREVNLLKDKLTEIIMNVKSSSETLMGAGHDLSAMANETSATADEISRAVEGISNGAFSQAGDVESATVNVADMGDVISRIVDKVSTLDMTSNQMEESRDSAMSIIEQLANSNKNTLQAIENIGQQIQVTNESATKISEAIQIISSIAEETNLLSLNASIEAARAGEQGRGFAVVASQIQTLADQSNESSQKIKKIVEDLINESNRTVAIMVDVEKEVNEEAQKLTQTREEFEQVSRGITETRYGTNEIKDQTVICNTSREGVVDIMSNLSAISEENAASTEETMASMEELNATINLLASSADDLVNLSKELEEQIAFFQI